MILNLNLLFDLDFEDVEVRKEKFVLFILNKVLY